MSVAISNLRVTLDEQALLQKRVRLRIEGITLRVSQEAALRMPLAGGKVHLERFTGGVIRFNTTFTPIGATGELRLSATQQGRAQLELLTVRAAGLLPLPRGLVVTEILRQMQSQGIRGVTRTSDTVLEIDPSQAVASVLAKQAPNVEVTVAPLKALRAGEGVLELEI